MENASVRKNSDKIAREIWWPIFGKSAKTDNGLSVKDMEKIKVKIENVSDNSLPARTSPQAAGMDVHAWLDKPLTIPPFGRVLVPTGLKMEMPRGYECQIRPRSGLALHHGITVLNTPGTIDADSRSEIAVILINLSNEPFTLHPGDRFCQLVFKPCLDVEWEETTRLDHTKREDNSFGGSGISDTDDSDQV